MTPWLQERLGILKAALPRPLLLLAFAVLQAARIILGLAHPRPDGSLWSRVPAATPWYVWVIGWLLLFWIGSIEYSVGRKRNFDKTSLNFFRAFLDFLIKEGHQLFQRSGDEDFYSRVSDWQRMVIEGMAIGLGHRESADYFERMDGRYPLADAYRESRSSGSNEPLCRALQGNLEELESVRKALADKDPDEKDYAGSAKKADLSGRPGPPGPPLLPPD